MTYTVKVEQKMRRGRGSNWERPYWEHEYQLEEKDFDLLVKMHIMNGYTKNVWKTGEVTLYKQTSCETCEVITITENK